MSYLLRTETDYRICYGRPSRPYVVAFDGSYFCADEYQKLCEEERELEAHNLMVDESTHVDFWADTCQNDNGIIVSTNIAEYLLQGKSIDTNSFVELEVSADKDKE